MVVIFFFFFFNSRQDLTVYSLVYKVIAQASLKLRNILLPQASEAGITGVSHHVWLLILF